MDLTRDITSTWLGVLSQRYRATFEGKQLVVRRSSTVHGVAWSSGLGGHSFPIPACHVGVTGWDIEAVQPSDLPVTCERCLYRAYNPRADLPVDDPDQLALDLDT